jgi:hypothetical protein
VHAAHAELPEAQHVLDPPVRRFAEPLPSPVGLLWPWGRAVVGKGRAAMSPSSVLLTNFMS